MLENLTTSEILELPAYEAAFEKISIAFLVRDGWTIPEAKFELKIIKERVGIKALVEGFSAKKNPRLVNEVYIELNRKGSKKPMNRIEKVGVALLLNNAANHSFYEIGCR